MITAMEYWPAQPCGSSAVHSHREYPISNNPQSCRIATTELMLESVSILVQVFLHTESSSRGRILCVELLLLQRRHRSMALSLLEFYTLILTSSMPQWPWHFCLASVVACIWVCFASLVIASRKLRFIVLTTTLQVALVPFYMGMYLAVMSPAVTFGTLLGCIRCSVYLSLRHCLHSTRGRRCRFRLTRPLGVLQGPYGSCKALKGLRRPLRALACKALEGLGGP